MLLTLSGASQTNFQRIVARLDRPSGNITGFADFGDASLRDK